MTFVHDMKEGWGVAILVSGGRKLQKKGPVSAKTKRQKYAWVILQTLRKAVWAEQNTQEED